MGKIDVFRPSTLQIDGASCVPWTWARFNPRRSSEQKGAMLFRDQILNNVVNHPVPAGSSHYLLIKELAIHATSPILVESLSKELNKSIFPRGRVLFGFVGNILDQTVGNYPGLEWWVSDKGLNVGPVLRSEPSLSDFDRLAGKLMAEARSRGEGKYLPQAEYERIAVELDRAAFDLRHQIAGRARTSLATWNQRNPRKAIKTFQDAIRKVKRPGLEAFPRSIKKRFYRAAEEYSKAIQ